MPLQSEFSVLHALRRTALSLFLISIAACSASDESQPQASVAESPSPATVHAEPRDSGPSSPDWPEWRGPLRDGISPGSGLLQSWPEGGPPLLWTTDGLGQGYSSASMKGDRLFIQGALRGKSMLFGLNRATGEILWSLPTGPMFKKNTGSGPGGTPSIDAERVYALSAMGRIVCAHAASGEPIWSRDLVEDFGGRRNGWGFTESPLVVGDLLIVSPGSAAATTVALDKMTGKTVWKADGLNGRAGYASYMARDIDGRGVLLGFTAVAGVGLDAATGKLLWSYDGAANGSANATMPIYRDNKVYYTSAYGTGCGLIQLTPTAEGFDYKQVYFNKKMKNHFGGVVLVGDHLYGSSGEILTCMEFDTGKVAWTERGGGGQTMKGTIAFADGHLYLQTEDDRVLLIEATPDGYVGKGSFRFKKQRQSARATPVISGGRLYIRNQSYLSCYDIGERPS